MKRRSQECLGAYPKRVVDRFVNLYSQCRMHNQDVHSHIWLFDGAEGGKWLADFETARAQAVQTSDPAPDAPAPMSEGAPRDAKRARVL
jgi:hypothetical protein